MYTKAKIYRLVNSIDNRIYIGSISLYDRMSRHKVAAATANTKIYQTMRDIGIDKFSIELICNYPCDGRGELIQREQDYITAVKPELNVRDAARPEGQTIVEYRRLYYQLHRTILLTRSKQYYQTRKQNHLKEIIANA